MLDTLGAYISRFPPHACVLLDVLCVDVFLIDYPTDVIPEGLRPGFEVGFALVGSY